MMRSYLLALLTTPALADLTFSWADADVFKDKDCTDLSAFAKLVQGEKLTFSDGAPYLFANETACESMSGGELLDSNIFDTWEDPTVSGEDEADTEFYIGTDAETGEIKTQTCGWLANKNAKQIGARCKKDNERTEAPLDAKDACTNTCGRYVTALKGVFVFSPDASCSDMLKVKVFPKKWDKGAGGKKTICSGTEIEGDFAGKAKGKCAITCKNIEECVGYQYSRTPGNPNNGGGHSCTIFSEITGTETGGNQDVCKQALDFGDTLEGHIQRKMSCDTSTAE